MPLGWLCASQDARCAAEQRVLHDLAQRDGGHVHPALGETPAAEELALPVETGLIQKLPPGSWRSRRMKYRPLASTELRIVSWRGVAVRVLADRGHKRQQQSCALADARHLHQLLARGEEHPHQASRSGRQRVGQLIRVAPRDGVVEQQLQHLVLREAVQSVAGEALLHALAVPSCRPMPIPPSGPSDPGSALAEQGVDAHGAHVDIEDGHQHQNDLQNLVAGRLFLILVVAHIGEERAGQAEEERCDIAERGVVLQNASAE